MDARGKTILLVEDCEKYGNATVRALEANHIANELVGARSGEQALEVLFGPGSGDVELPQVVLLDLDLPGMGGLEVLRRIRADARTRHLPVVVLTSSKEEEDVLHSYSLGANGFVRKPLEFTTLVQAVKALGLFWLLVNETPTGTAPPSEGTRS